MALRALIFDVDGTLANTERDGHLIAFNAAFKELGLNWIWSNQLYHQLLDITGGQLRIKHYVNNYNPDFVCDDLNAFALKAHKLKTKIYVSLVNQGKIPIRTGVVRLLNEVREAGLRLAIASTTTLANIEALIINTLGSEVLSWFEVIGAGNIVANLKPAGDIYHWVLEEMNLDAKDCIVFEDSHNGIVAATQANLKTLITVNQYTQNHQFDGAMVVLDNLGEPNKPFTIIDGDNTKATYVGVNYLSELHAKHC